jgi:hypothetical protein
MSILLTSDVIRGLCSDGRLTVIEKKQKNGGDYNYYITPNLAFRLYRGKVIVSDTKYIVLQFDKYTNLNLLHLLRTTTSCISNYLKSCIDINTDLIYPLCSEQDNTFTIRMSLPHVRQKYFIEAKSLEENEVIPFRKPFVGTILTEAQAEIRNLWQNKGRIGFNIELKHVGL